MLTFESNAVQGTSGIVEKLVGLPFQKIKHQVATLDAQPSSEQGGILVMVTGALLVRLPMTSTSSSQDRTCMHLQIGAIAKRIATGRRRRTTDELHPSLPAPTRRPRQLFCLQRHVQADLRMICGTPSPGILWPGICAVVFFEDFGSIWSFTLDTSKLLESNIKIRFRVQAWWPGS